MMLIKQNKRAGIIFCKLYKVKKIDLGPFHFRGRGGAWLDLGLFISKVATFILF